MRAILGIGIPLMLLVGGCNSGLTGASMNRAEALSVSDSFMANLIADKVNLAVDQMEPEFVKASGRAQAENIARQLFDYCGRPLEGELRHEEIGTFLYPNGRSKPMRAFYYSGKTTQNRKGVCFFAVRVVPAEKGMRVVNFGPLKLVEGQLPEWAR